MLGRQLVRLQLDNERRSGLRPDGAGGRCVVWKVRRRPISAGADTTHSLSAQNVMPFENQVLEGAHSWAQIRNATFSMGL